MQRDVVSNGVTPDIVQQVNNLQAPPLKALASTDCIVRYHIVARPGIRAWRS